MSTIIYSDLYFLFYRLGSHRNLLVLTPFFLTLRSSEPILITMGGMIFAEQMIHVIWCASPIPLRLPEGLRGSIVIGDAAMERYRVIAVDRKSTRLNSSQ